MRYMINHTCLRTAWASWTRSAAGLALNSAWRAASASMAGEALAAELMAIVGES